MTVGLGRGSKNVTFTTVHATRTNEARPPPVETTPVAISTLPDTIEDHGDDGAGGFEAHDDREPKRTRKDDKSERVSTFVYLHGIARSCYHRLHSFRNGSNTGMNFSTRSYARQVFADNSYLQSAIGADWLVG